jgi:hypothetical protein
VALTDDQAELFRERPELTVADGQTENQARNFGAASFRYICALEGVGMPSQADVLAEMDKARAVGGRTHAYPAAD